MKKLFIPILLLFVAMALPARVYAGEEDRVFLRTNVYYDKADGMFTYVMEDVGGAEIKTNVVDGMMTNGPVSISCNIAFTLLLYRNGVQVDNPDMSNITEPGAYVLQIQGTGNSYMVMKFTIVGRFSSVENYRLPAGFAISRVYMNDEDLELSGGEVEFSTEGYYIVESVCINTGEEYSVTINTDFTKPVLALEGVVDGVARGVVDLRDAEQGSTLYVERDGVYIGSPLELTQTGKYYVKITDMAGNFSEYYFDIIVHLDVITVLFIVVFFVLIGALGVYLLMSRRKMKVR